MPIVNYFSPAISPLSPAVSDQNSSIQPQAKTGGSGKNFLFGALSAAALGAAVIGGIAFNKHTQVQNIISESKILQKQSDEILSEASSVFEKAKSQLDEVAELFKRGKDGGFKDFSDEARKVSVRFEDELDADGLIAGRVMKEFDSESNLVRKSVFDEFDSPSSIMIRNASSDDYIINGRELDVFKDCTVDDKGIHTIKKLFTFDNRYDTLAGSDILSRAQLDVKMDKKIFDINTSPFMFDGLLPDDSVSTAKRAFVYNNNPLRGSYDVFSDYDAFKRSDLTELESGRFLVGSYSNRFTFLPDNSFIYSDKTGQIAVKDDKIRYFAKILQKDNN